MMPQIQVISEKDKSVRRGHPWVFPKAIKVPKVEPKCGELVELIDQKGQVLAYGAYNPHSLYRVRVLAYPWEKLQGFNYLTLIQHRLQQAWQLRQTLNLPNQATNAFRLFNSEAEGLSGLTIDYFDGILVVSSTAYWVEAQAELIKDSLKKIIPCQDILWFPQAKALEQDGWTSTDTPCYELSKTVSEAGIFYQVNFKQAQKTGLFLDQRENHQRLAALVKGKSVLDLYTYSGGFALHAAAAGAKKVTAVDSSAAAIEQANHNASLNHLTQIEFIKADAREYLSKAGDYEVVILDPPKLVPGRAHLEKAKNYYRYLHREVFNVMKPNSLLMTCNCSSALKAQDFVSLVEEQAREKGRLSRVLGVYGPAQCHPVTSSFPEGAYLTAVLLALQ